MAPAALCMLQSTIYSIAYDIMIWSLSSLGGGSFHPLDETLGLMYQSSAHTYPLHTVHVVMVVILCR